MDHAEAIRIAAHRSYWDVQPPKTVPRKLSLPTELRPGVALILQGVRRCGKSTLMTQLMDRYGLDRRHCLFVNFEDPRLAGSLDHTTLQTFVDAFEAGGVREATYFLDEIQWVDGWQRWLRAQLDRPRDRRFVVTGSSAHLLAGELGSTLTGRHHLVEVFPFDLDEYRDLRPGAGLSEFLDAGAFPAPALSPDRDRMLQGYFHDIVERDMRERVSARSSRPLLQVAQMLFESAGSELSVRRVAAAIGVAVDTAGLYIEAAASADLAFGCPYFAWSQRKQAVRNRKYYPIDTGLRRIAVVRTGADRGKQLECAVFLLLRRRHRQVCYWRGRGEVDFVVEHEGRATPVQVGWDGPLERHLKALDEFHEAHPNAAEGVFISAASFEQGVPELPGAGASGP